MILFTLNLEELWLEEQGFILLFFFEELAYLWRLSVLSHSLRRWRLLFVLFLSFLFVSFFCSTVLRSNRALITPPHCWGRRPFCGSANHAWALRPWAGFIATVPFTGNCRGLNYKTTACWVNGYTCIREDKAELDPERNRYGGGSGHSVFVFTCGCLDCPTSIYSSSQYPL